MPKKNTAGGKKHKRGKGNLEREKRPLEFKSPGTEYGQVLKMLGSGRCDVQCGDGVKRMCTIRGKMRKKVWVNIHDIVLVSLRDFQDAKADIILKYQPDEARQLRTLNELPEGMKVNEAADVEGDESSDDAIVFGEEEEDINLEEI